MSRVALVVHEGREAAVRAAGDIEAMLTAEGAETARAHDGEAVAANRAGGGAVVTMALPTSVPEPAVLRPG